MKHLKILLVKCLPQDSKYKNTDVFKQSVFDNIRYVLLLIFHQTIFKSKLYIHVA